MESQVHRDGFEFTMEAEKNRKEQKSLRGRITHLPYWNFLAPKNGLKDSFTEICRNFTVKGVIHFLPQTFPSSFYMLKFFFSFRACTDAIPLSFSIFCSTTRKTPGTSTVFSLTWRFSRTHPIVSFLTGSIDISTTFQHDQLNMTSFFLRLLCAEWLRVQMYSNEPPHASVALTYNQKWWFTIGNDRICIINMFSQ